MNAQMIIVAVMFFPTSQGGKLECEELATLRDSLYFFCRAAGMTKFNRSDYPRWVINGKWFAESMSVAGKIALVTGGGDGIGRAVCEALGREGASVIVCDINVDGANETVDLLGKPRAQHHIAVQADVTKSACVDDLASKILTSYGGQAPNIVVNCAGVAPNLLGTESETEENFDRVIDVNLKGTFLICRKFALLLKEREAPGSFVNMGSIVIPGFAASPGYGASKGGVLSLTKSMAKDLAKNGIRFNVVSPGIIDTNLIAKGNIPAEDFKIMTAQPCIAPMGRRGTPRDVAEGITHKLRHACTGNSLRS